MSFRTYRGRGVVAGVAIVVMVGLIGAACGGGGTRDIERLEGRIAALQDTNEALEAEVVGLSSVYEAAVAAGMPPDTTTFGHGSYVWRQISLALGPPDSVLRSKARLRDVERLTPQIQAAVLSAFRGISDPHADPASTIDALHAAAVEAGMEPTETDFGRASVVSEVELRAELASRPRVEVMRVAVRSTGYSPDFNVVLRNNHNSPIRAIETRLYAYNAFGDGLGGQCGRFPTYYSSNIRDSAARGAQVTLRYSSLCLDTATRAEVKITRVLFSDGTVWAP